MNGGTFVVSLAAFALHLFWVDCIFIFLPYAAALSSLKNGRKDENTGDIDITLLSIPWIHQERSVRLRSKGGVLTNAQSL